MKKLFCALQAVVLAVGLAAGLAVALNASLGPLFVTTGYGIGGLTCSASVFGAVEDAESSANLACFEHGFNQAVIHDSVFLAQCSMCPAGRFVSILEVTFSCQSGPLQ